MLSVLLVVLSPAIAHGQQAVVTAFGNGGGPTASPDFQMTVLVGQTFIGQSIGPTQSVHYGFWLAEEDLVATSPVANEWDGTIPEGPPSKLTLEPNYPNPVSSRTTVRFGLPEVESVQLTVIDALGRVVRLTRNEESPAGWHTVHVATDNLPSGTYFIRLDAGGQSRVRPMLVVH
jgi:hypothetical protein